MLPARLALTVVVLLAVFPPIGSGRTIRAEPGTYRDLLSTLRAGDRLLLSGGEYPRGLDLFDLHGTASQWIVISGPPRGEPAVFPAARFAHRNTIEIKRSSYLALLNLKIDGRDVAGVFGISAGGGTRDHSHQTYVKAEALNKMLR